MNSSPVALITGAGKRIGKAIASYLHAQGYRVVLHYRSSGSEAETLCRQLNETRNDSAIAVGADFNEPQAYAYLVNQGYEKWRRLDALVHNASSFYPTPIAEASLVQWQDLFASNSKAAFFLAQASAPKLKETQGSIVNIIDIYGFKPLKGYSIYNAAKASLVMLTKNLALELAPQVRVNGVAPGSILWPEALVNQLDESRKQALLQKIPLKRLGDPHNIARTVYFLLTEDYIDGEIIKVDGGKSLVT
jgi:pteridine reductase